MLEIRNLCAGYEGTERLHRLDAAFAPGELTAVIGPNGCGKSTLIKCIAGILKPSAGEILLDGVPLCARSARERARMIAYMPQSRLVPDISVRNLAMHGRYPHLGWGRNPRLEDREIVRDALRRTEMEAHANRSVAHLSGGERQRAYLAMMLAQQTPVMLLDEPTAALDLAAQFALMDLLRALCAQGRSVIVVLHDLALALEYADRVLLLRNGALAAAGTPDRIFNGETLEAVFGVRARRLEDGKYVFYSCEGNFASFCK